MGIRTASPDIELLRLFILHRVLWIRKSVKSDKGVTLTEQFIFIKSMSMMCKSLFQVEHEKLVTLIRAYSLGKRQKKPTLYFRQKVH